MAHEWVIQPLEVIPVSALVRTHQCLRHALIRSLPYQNRESFDTLPSSKYALFGTLVHEFIDAIARDPLPEDNFDEHMVDVWNRLRDELEHNAQTEPKKAHLVPLRDLPGYDRKRDEAFDRAWNMISQRRVSSQRRAELKQPDSTAEGRTSRARFGTEIDLRVEVHGIGVRAIIDEVRPADPPMIVDLKTGMLLNSEDELKEIYRRQVLFYARIWSQTNWDNGPVEAVVEGLDGRSSHVSYDASEARRLLEESVQSILIGYASVQRAANHFEALNLLAQPTLLACKHCPYRTSCTAYIEAWPLLEAEEHDIQDIVGTLIDPHETGSLHRDSTVLGRDRGFTPESMYAGVRDMHGQDWLVQNLTALERNGSRSQRNHDAITHLSFGDPVMVCGVRVLRLGELHILAQATTDHAIINRSTSGS